MASSPSSRPPLGLALVGLLVLAAPACAEFPRGPGFYYSPTKLVVLVLSFFGWVALCAWVNRDALAYKLDAERWNGLMLVAGLLGLVLLWQLTAFWLTWFLFWLFVLGAYGAYVYKRNDHASDEDKLFTPRHFKYLAAQYLHLRFENIRVKGRGPGVPVRILKRSDGGRQHQAEEMTRVQENKGYRGALDMIYEAVQKRATDIHLEPAAEEMTVRFRVDGLMTNMKPFSRSMGDAVVNIFKVICNLDITEKRKAQDGSFSAQVEERAVEFRVATAGSVQGEKMVMRILDATQSVSDLSQVGMTDEMREQIRDLVTRPHGMILVCGPTGSGKSTTLYACLHEIDRFSKNIITIENPVEYRLDNVTQIEVNPKAGKTFAGELRSILRQDPDVIMIGEIRDKETAEIACQAAQTGHLVFTTIHANDTVTAIGRLIDLGVQPFMVASALSAVLGQRLVRRLCRKCRQRYKPTAETLKRLHADPDLVRYLYRSPDPPEREKDDEDEEGEGPEVCEMCGGTGYFKRTGIFELFVLDDRIRELIRENPNLASIKTEAVKHGLKSLFEDGSRLVTEGQTSIQELLRVSK